MVTIAPAILVYSESDLRSRIASVPSAQTLHIDIMDGKFVNNITIGPDQLHDLPPRKEVEFHLMVADPLAFIEALPGGQNRIFQVHLESVKPGEERKISQAVNKKGARLCWVLNPSTPLERLLPVIARTSQVLVMTVNPGWAGQAYIKDVEEKISALRLRYPNIAIEIDGGVGAKTIPRAIEAGADRFAAASAVFGQKKPDEALRALMQIGDD